MQPSTSFLRLVPAALLAAVSMAGHAADWSDTALSVRYGTKFAEPYGSTDITKTIVALTHASGYKYGSNFFNVDLLESNSNDPGGGTAGNPGAQEAYMVYRNTLDIGKVAGMPMAFGPVRGVGVTAGFDLNSKNDAYASKKRMYVVGPTLMFDVPGFANLTALVLKESNAPSFITSRYTYKTHGALELDWGLPIGGLPLSFGGYAQMIASKGNNESGGPTSTETHIDMKLMLDVGALAAGTKGTFQVGVAYEYWKNKFGNPTTDVIGPGAGPGATAKTPMVRAEYHF